MADDPGAARLQAENELAELAELVRIVRFAPGQPTGFLRSDLEAQQLLWQWFLKGRAAALVSLEARCAALEFSQDTEGERQTVRDTLLGLRNRAEAAEARCQHLEQELRQEREAIPLDFPVQLVAAGARIDVLEQLVQELYAVHPAWVPPELDARVTEALVGCRSLADALREAPPQTDEEKTKTLARGETLDYSVSSSPPQPRSGDK